MHPHYADYDVEALQTAVHHAMFIAHSVHACSVELYWLIHARDQDLVYAYIKFTDQK